MRKPTQEEIIERFKKAHGDKFDYSKVNYVNSSTKVKIICPIHGEFEQLPSDHANGRGCNKCGRETTGRKKRLTQKQFLEKIKKVHGDRYDYSKTKYKTSNDKITIICPKHGEFQQTAIDHLTGRGCPKCGQEMRNKKNTNSQKEFVEKAQLVHNNLYDYSKVVYSGSYEPITIICEKHGEFEQTPNNHLQGAGCPKCGRDACGEQLKKSTEQFIIDARKKHGDRYDYSMTEYNGAKHKVKVGCDKHGAFEIMPISHTLLGFGCPICSHHKSRPEIEISNFLKKHNLEFLENTRKIIKPLELDFYIPDKNLAIEYDGLYYHTEISGNKDRNYHLNKTLMCEEQGIQLIHIFEDEWLNNKNLVLFKLKSLLGLNKWKIPARKCEVREIDYQTKHKFIEKYHLQGDCASSINLGLFYKNRLVMVMTFSKRRKALGAKSEDGFELVRLCSVKGFNILGGASKLLHRFEQLYRPNKIISYADRRWSNGAFYEKLGFNFTHSSRPNYWYVQTERQNLRHHRYGFAKHVLSEKLEEFDSNLSEWDNMKRNEYDRIWDAGTFVFEKAS